MTLLYKNRCYNSPQYTSYTFNTELTVADFLFYIDVKAVKSRVRSEVTTFAINSQDNFDFTQRVFNSILITFNIKNFSFL